MNEARRTPTTPGGLLKYDHLPAVEAVIAAWCDLGTHPDWHLACRQQVREAMPLLTRAITRLTIEHGRVSAEGRAAP